MIFLLTRFSNIQVYTMYTVLRNLSAQLQLASFIQKQNATMSHWFYTVRYCTCLTKTKILSMQDTEYFLKIAKLIPSDIIVIQFILVLINIYSYHCMIYLCLIKHIRTIA